MAKDYPGEGQEAYDQERIDHLLAQRDTLAKALEWAHERIHPRYSQIDGGGFSCLPSCPAHRALDSLEKKE